MQCQIAQLEQAQRDFKERTPAPLTWTPDNLRKDDPTKCKCSASVRDPYCYCGV